MLVPALVVQPGGGVALLQLFRRVGAAGALVVTGPHQEFLGAVLGEIVQQTLPDEPHPEAEIHDCQLVFGDGVKVFGGGF